MQPARDTERRDNGLHLVFLASPLTIRDSLAQMLAASPLRDLSADERGTAEVVLAEVLNNIAEHAYPAGTGPVAVTIRQGPGGTECLVVDQGLGMPGDGLPDGQLPGTDTDLAGLPEGGFGWHLIHALARDLSYVRTGGCNRLSFVLPKGS